MAVTYIHTYSQKAFGDSRGDEPFSMYIENASGAEDLIIEFDVYNYISFVRWYLENEILLFTRLNIPSI